MSVAIANGALDRINVDPIESLGKAGGKKARLINRHLKRSVELVLRRVLWSETTVNVCPDPLAVCDCCALPCGYNYAFALPKDFIRAYRVQERNAPKDDGDDCKDCRSTEYFNKPASYYLRNIRGRSYDSEAQEAWRIMTVHTPTGKCPALLSNCSEVQLEYVCVPENLDALPVDMQEAIELQLAVRISQPLKANQKLREMVQRDLDVHIEMAKQVSGAQDQEMLYLEDGDILDARSSAFYGSGAGRGSGY